jgi:hypothetical protein
MAVSLFCGFVQVGELLRFLIVLFFERLHLRVGRDKVVHTSKVAVFNCGNLRA